MKDHFIDHEWMIFHFTHMTEDIYRKLHSSPSIVTTTSINRVYLSPRQSSWYILSNRLKRNCKMAANTLRLILSRLSVILTKVYWLGVKMINFLFDHLKCLTVPWFRISLKLFLSICVQLRLNWLDSLIQHHSRKLIIMNVMQYNATLSA